MNSTSVEDTSQPQLRLSRRQIMGWGAALPMIACLSGLAMPVPAAPARRGRPAIYQDQPIIDYSGTLAAYCDPAGKRGCAAIAGMSDSSLYRLHYFV